MVSEPKAPAAARPTALIALLAAKPGWKYMSEPPACGHSLRPLDVLAAIAMALVAASSDRPSAKLPASAAPGGATRPVGRWRRARSEVSSARPIRAPVS